MAVEGADQPIFEIARPLRHGLGNFLDAEALPFSELCGVMLLALQRRCDEGGVRGMLLAQEHLPLDRVVMLVDLQRFERFKRIGREQAQPESHFIDRSHSARSFNGHTALGQHDRSRKRVHRAPVHAHRRWRLCVGRPAIAGVLMFLKQPGGVAIDVPCEIEPRRIVFDVDRPPVLDQRREQSFFCQALARVRVFLLAAVIRHRTGVASSRE